jgi:hypothetical protein
VKSFVKTFDNIIRPIKVEYPVLYRGGVTLHKIVSLQAENLFFKSGVISMKKCYEEQGGKDPLSVFLYTVTGCKDKSLGFKSGAIGTSPLDTKRLDKHWAGFYIGDTLEHALGYAEGTKTIVQEWHSSRDSLTILEVSGSFISNGSIESRIKAEKIIEVLKSWGFLEQEDTRPLSRILNDEKLIYIGPDAPDNKEVIITPSLSPTVRGRKSKHYTRRTPLKSWAPSSLSSESDKENRRCGVRPSALSIRTDGSHLQPFTPILTDVTNVHRRGPHQLSTLQGIFQPFAKM